MRIEVKDTLKELSKEVGLFQKQYIKEATTRALNKVGNTATSRSMREIRKDFNMSLGDFKQGKYIISKRATKGKQYYDIVFANKYASLFKMGAAQNKTGVTVKAWGKKQRYDGAFIATMPNGKRDVYIRIGGRRGPKRRVVSGKNVGKLYQPELPIKKLFGPYVPTSLRQRKLDEVVNAIVAERFPIEFRRAIISVQRRRLKL